MSTSPLRILHLSDTHLLEGGSLHNGLVDTRAALQRVLDRAATIESLDLVVASGDLSDDGSAATYRMLHELLEPWAEARGAVVAYVMGNHDGREGFESVLGARVGVIDVHGFRVVRLDSSVPGFGYGALGDEQLEWLRNVLSAPSPHGSILVVHHPPVPAPTALLAGLELVAPERLAAVVSGSDVRVVLSGHYHAGLAAQFAGVPVIVAPGVANTVDPLALPGTERLIAGSGFALVEVARQGDAASAGVRSTFLAAAAPDDGRELFTLDAEAVQRILAEAGHR